MNTPDTLDALVDIWHCHGDLTQYKDGVIVATIKYNSLSSFLREPVVLLRDYDALRSSLARLTEANERLERDAAMWEKTCTGHNGSQMCCKYYVDAAAIAAQGGGGS